MSILQAIKGFFKGFRGGYSSGAASRRAKEELERAIPKPAIPQVTRKKNEDFSGLGFLLLLLLLGVGCYALWEAAVERGYIPLDKVTIVTAKNWTTGEYKSCTSPNTAEMKGEPQIDCTSSMESGEPKKFQVRFYGATFREDLKNVSFAWRCQRNDGTNPAFTCDEQKIVKWDEKN
jgi:hypothetical protein